MVTVNQSCLSIIPVCGKPDPPTPAQILPNLLAVVDGRIYLLPAVAPNRLNSTDEQLIPEREVFQHRSAVSGNNRHSLIKPSS